MVKGFKEQKISVSKLNFSEFRNTFLCFRVFASHVILTSSGLISWLRYNRYWLVRHQKDGEEKFEFCERKKRPTSKVITNWYGSII